MTYFYSKLVGLMASKAQPKKVVKQKSEKPPELYRSTSHELSSVHLGRPVHVEIIGPKTVSGPLPLLVLNDGQDSAAVGVKKSVERETATGRIPKILVVGVAAGDRMAEYGTAFRADYEGRGAKAGLYAKFVVLELMPWLAERYSISENPAERAVAGYSLGGLSAVDLAWNQPHIFGKTGVFSGSLWWRRYTMIERMLGPDRGRLMHLQIRKTRKRPDLKFWFQTGTHDEETDRNNNGVIDAVDDTLDLMSALTRKGYRPYHDFAYCEIREGRHNPETWKKAMPLFLRWAFGDGHLAAMPHVDDATV